MLVQDECTHSAYAIQEEQDMLVLYCQQLAFAPEIPRACGQLITCRQRELRYFFPPFNHYVDENIYYEKQDAPLPPPHLPEVYDYVPAPAHLQAPP